MRTASPVVANQVASDASQLLELLECTAQVVDAALVRTLRQPIKIAMYRTSLARGRRLLVLGDHADFGRLICDSSRSSKVGHDEELRWVSSRVRCV